MATKFCYLAYLDAENYEFIMNKHKAKKEEKLLNIVRNLPYFKGVTRNTALKIAGFFEKHQPCLNQVLIRQGDKIKNQVVIIIHKGEFKVTKKV